MHDAYVQEDGEETEFVIPALEPEEQDADSITYHDSHKRAMERIHEWWPEKFKVEDSQWLSEAHMHFKYKGSTPRFIVDTKIFLSSFFDAPVWTNEAPNTGIFPFDTRFPRGPTP